MVEVPRRFPVEIEWYDKDYDGTGGDGWFVSFKGLYIGPNPIEEPGYQTASEAVAAAEKWASDRGFLTPYKFHITFSEKRLT